MSNHACARTKFRIIVLFVAGILSSCASVPSFRPSLPVESATSLPQALLLCNEFSLPANPIRPVLLRPLVDCIKEAGEYFPDDVFPNYLTFQDELSRKYDSMNSTVWTPRMGVEIEIAIHAILRNLWREGAKANQENEPDKNMEMSPGLVNNTATEREMVLRHFARTAQAIQAEHWSSGAEPVLEPRLESLRALVAGMADDPKEAGSSGQISPGNLETLGRLCERYAQLNSELEYLTFLWRDLVDMTLIDPRSEANDRARRRYLERVDRALGQAQALRTEISRARESAKFQLSMCRPRDNAK